MEQAVNDSGKIKLKKSLYSLTRQLTEIEMVFNAQIHEQFNQVLTQHQELIITTCKSLDHIEEPMT